MKKNQIDEALRALAKGELVIVVDDEGRENEGDLIIAAEFATPEKIAFMVRYTSGVLCIGMSGERLDELNIPLMVKSNTDNFSTAFTVTVDSRSGIKTGISSYDRAFTFRALVDSSSKSSDFNKPGHVFPLRANDGGVLKRRGHTEAAVDLTRMAGLKVGGVLAEIVNEDGTMARRPELESFASAHGLCLITIDDLVEYRKLMECAEFIS